MCEPVFHAVTFLAFSRHAQPSAALGDVLETAADHHELEALPVVQARQAASATGRSSGRVYLVFDQRDCFGLANHRDQLPPLSPGIIEPSGCDRSGSPDRLDEVLTSTTFHPRVQHGPCADVWDLSIARRPSILDGLQDSSGRWGTQARRVSPRLSDGGARH